MAAITDSVFYGQGRIFYDDGTTITEVGQLTGCDVDVTIDRDEYKGNSTVTQFSMVKGIKVSGKAQSGTFLPSLLAKAMGATSATGKTNQYTESKTIAASVTVTNAATFVESLTVLDPNGKPMTKVASGPAAGQFSVTTGGVYSFASADVTAFSGKQVTITYRATVATGKTYSITGGAAQQTQRFRLVLSNPDISGTPQTMVIYAAVIEKFSKSGKTLAYSETSIDFSAEQDSLGRFVDVTDGI